MSEGGNSNDGIWMLFFIIAFICVFFVGIWFVLKPQILQGYLWVRQGEVAIASLWTDNDDVINIGKTSTMTFGEASELIQTLTPKILLRDDVKHWQIIQATSAAILTPLKIPSGIIFLFMAGYAMFRGPTSYFRKTINLDGLIEKQSRTFKIVQPFVKFNPLNDIPPRSPGDPVPAELPLFAEALGPEEWLAFHKIPLRDGKLNKESAHNAFTHQLGGKWQGMKKLAPYLQVLLAAFALKTARKRIESDNLLGELAICWNHKDGLKLNRDIISRSRKILKNKEISEITLNECNRHAYISTALIGALEKARSEGGVLAPAQFVWLRGHDRLLWYPLNNLGRQSFHMEAVGTISHYRAEKHVKRPIPKPMVNDAVITLNAYVNDPQRIQPIPQLDFSMIKNKQAPNKNKGVMKPMGT